MKLVEATGLTGSEIEGLRDPQSLAGAMAVARMMSSPAEVIHQADLAFEDSLPQYPLPLGAEAEQLDETLPLAS